MDSSLFFWYCNDFTLRYLSKSTYFGFDGHFSVKFRHAVQECLLARSNKYYHNHLHFFRYSLIRKHLYCYWFFQPAHCVYQSVFLVSYWDEYVLLYKILDEYLTRKIIVTSHKEMDNNENLMTVNTYPRRMTEYKYRTHNF